MVAPQSRTYLQGAMLKYPIKKYLIKLRLQDQTNP